MRGQIWCIFGFSSSQKVWLMRVYGLREVWVKRGLTVAPYSSRGKSPEFADVDVNRLGNSLRILHYYGTQFCTRKC
jgi:hypothetical protein